MQVTDIQKDGLTKQMIKLVTDSTAYIPEALLKKHDISVLSLSVSFGSDVYKETEITNTFFFDTLDAFDGFPKSSQPSLEESMNLYESILEAGHDLIGVFISSEMSGTYQSANMLVAELKDQYPDRKIQMIDSRSNCMQLGLAVLKAAEIADSPFEKVVEKIHSVIEKSRFIFIPDTMEYLKKGGRIGSAKALLSTMLQIKPILTVEDGKTAVLNKVRTRKKALQALVDQFKADGLDHPITGAFVHHIDCKEDAKKLSEALGQAYDITAIGPVIGTHVGPGAIGIAYCWE